MIHFSGCVGGATALALAAGVQAAAVNPIEVTSSFSPKTGLTLAVTNYSKKPQTIEAVDVVIGGQNGRGGCTLLLPRLDLAPTARSATVVARAADVATCLGPAAARTLTSELPVLPRLQPPLAAVARRPTFGRPVIANTALQVRVTTRVASVATAEPIVFGLASVPLLRRP